MIDNPGQDETPEIPELVPSLLQALVAIVEKEYGGSWMCPVESIDEARASLELRREYVKDQNDVVYLKLTTGPDPVARSVDALIKEVDG